MKFVFGKQDMMTAARAQENCWLLGNGLGGFSSTTAAFSVTRNDHGILISARTAPNDRVNLVHRLSEKLTLGGRDFWLSTQDFADGTASEDGYRHLSSFVFEYGPQWTYDVAGAQLTRRCAVMDGGNTVAVCYRLENRTEYDASVEITPWMQFAPKGNAPQQSFKLRYSKGKVSGNDLSVRIKTDAKLEKILSSCQTLAYAYDEKDGRPPVGVAASCCRMTKTVAAGQTGDWEVIFSTDPIRTNGKKLLNEQVKRLKKREKEGNFRHPIARQLAMAAAEFVAHRESTDGKTILAGFPFFGDWGRDTMIALPGCVLSRNDFDTARSILRTFLAYEHQGLVPNLFPEGESQPMYNTVDAALLLINTIWLYHKKNPDMDFIRESWPVMKSVIANYKAGTLHGIHMDKDCLIAAGEGMENIFMEIGVDKMVEGGQSMNPSTEDILRAVDSVNAETVFVFPNNKNIILAAEQVDELTEKNVVVIPTKTIPQGISALLSFDPDAETEVNRDAMLEAVALVKTGSVTFAARDSEIDGMNIKKDDIMGMEEGKITHLGSNPADVVMELLSDMADSDSSMISVFYGSDVSEEDAAELEKKINEAYPKLDCMVHNGGQPLYYYIISIE